MFRSLVVITTKKPKGHHDRHMPIVRHCSVHYAHALID